MGAEISYCRFRQSNEVKLHFTEVKLHFIEVRTPLLEGRAQLFEGRARFIEVKLQFVEGKPKNCRASRVKVLPLFLLYHEKKAIRRASPKRFTEALR